MMRPFTKHNNVQMGRYRVLLKLTINETRLEGRAFEVYMTQLEEFKVAEAEGKNRGMKFGLLDTTEAMLLRPDGHPSHYGGHLQGFNNDCVHWCLPGPIDTLNEFLLDQMLKMEIGMKFVQAAGLNVQSTLGFIGDMHHISCITSLFERATIDTSYVKCSQTTEKDIGNSCKDNPSLFLQIFTYIAASGSHSMKLLQSIELPLWKNQFLQNTSKTTVLLAAILTFTLLTIIPLYGSPLLSYSFFTFGSSPLASSLSAHKDIAESSISMEPNKTCNIFKGQWVPSPDAPYYTNTTCWAMEEFQNCRKYGRPDTDFMKWRWRPDDCELPIFNPVQFLELLRGKSLAFVGDSVGRNHMQSLKCLLSKVEHPVDVSYLQNEQFQRWHYTNYNFTMASFWSPFLVRSKHVKPKTSTTGLLFHLHLDEFDENWATQVENFDYVIISGGRWFFTASMLFENGKLVGCQYCGEKNITEFSPYDTYRYAFKTAFKALETKFNGITFLRTISPTHFENGTWNGGGNCVRTSPLTRNETHLSGPDLKFHKIQLEEFKVAEAEARKRGMTFRLLDTTDAMVLRPDGHPSRYGHPREAKVVYNDCVHWCLPGPIDTWSEFLLIEMLRVEAERSTGDRMVYTSDRKMKIT